jgi:hypothetical protein
MLFFREQAAPWVLPYTNASYCIEGGRSIVVSKAGRRNMGGVWKRDFLGFFLVPNVFPSDSQRVPQVPKLFFKLFPIAPPISPIWFAQSLTLMYINWKVGNRRAHLFLIVQLGVQRGASIGVCKMFQNKLMIHQSIYGSFEKRKKLWEHP